MEGILGWMGLALLAALGGFLLNLTPCVLPVDPAEGHGHSEARRQAG
jgi:cytochrome c biogenesis protein CcdA